MIHVTKTEVLSAISGTEGQAGWAGIDCKPVSISAGHLRTLIEAAKCANYINTGGVMRYPPSNSELFLCEPTSISDADRP